MLRSGMYALCATSKGRIRDELLSETFFSNSMMPAKRSTSGLRTPTPPPAFLAELTRCRPGMQLTSTQPKRVKLLLGDSSVAGHDE